MRVLVLGGNGMLGHKLWQVFKDRFDAWVSVRSGYQAHAHYGIFAPERLVGGVDACDFDTVTRALSTVEPQVVVNAIGIIKQVAAAKDPIPSLTVNALFPHRLAALCSAKGARLIHISTDCVFSGKRGGYREDDVPDAEDLYGRTKLLGEVSGDGVLTLRTSIVGRELDGTNGLVEWFLSNRGGKVKGFTNAVFTGFSTTAIARVIAGVIEGHPNLSGLYHVSSEPIDKHRLLCLLRDAYEADIEIEPFADVRIDRSLDSSRFRAETSFSPQDWPEMVREMAADPTPYENWR